jgi:hypothetical protein
MATSVASASGVRPKIIRFNFSTGVSPLFEVAPAVEATMISDLDLGKATASKPGSPRTDPGTTVTGTVGAVTTGSITLMAVGFVISRGGAAGVVLVDEKAVCGSSNRGVVALVWRVWYVSNVVE